MAISYTQNWDSGTTGWNLSGVLSTTATGYSSPNALEISGGTSGIKYFATYATADGSGGSVEVVTKVKFTASTGSSATFIAGPAFRGSASTLNDSNTSFYWVGMHYRPKLGVFHVDVYKTVNGVTSTLSTLNIAGDINQNDWYEIKVRVTGTSDARIQASFLEMSTSKYLSPTSTDFDSTPYVLALDYTDASSPITGSGYSGIVYQSGSGGNIRADDFSLDPVGTVNVPATLGFTPSVSALREKLGSVTASIGLSATSAETRDAASSVSVTVGLTPAPTIPAGDFTAAATVSIGLAGVSSGPADKFSSLSVPISIAATSSEVRDIQSTSTATITLTPSDSAIADKVAAVTATFNLAVSINAAKNAAVYSASASDTIWLLPSPVGSKITASSVVDTFSIAGQPTKYSSPVSVAISDSFVLSGSSAASATRVYSASAGAFIALAATGLRSVQGTYSLSVAATIRLSHVVTETASALVSASIADTFNLAPSVVQSPMVLWVASASTSLLVRATPSQGSTRTFYVFTEDTVSASASALTSKDVTASVSDVLSMSALLLEASQMSRTASATVGIQPTVRAGRDIFVGVVESLALSGPTEPPNSFFPVANVASIGLQGVATKLLGPTRDLNLVNLGFVANVSATVLMPNGVGLVEGDPSTGLSTPVLSGFDPEWPLSFAETPEGDVIMANGVDRMAIWRALPATASLIGIQPPSTGPALGGTGAGTIIGRRVAFVRFIDSDGNESALSPMSNIVDFGWERPIDDISIDGNGKATITATDHNLVTGTTIVLRDVTGVAAVNGTVTVTRLDNDRFTVNGVYASGDWQGGGSLVYGTMNVVYSLVPTTSDTNVVRRQILRSLEGTADALYVDIDTTDLTSTTLASQRTDESLRQQDSVPTQDVNGGVFANRFLPPPSNKPLLATYAGRCWAAGEVSYATGCVFNPVPGLTVQGVGTRWKQSFVGRMLYLAGARQAYQIASVDESTQVITLSSQIKDSNLPRFCQYVIRSAPIERRTIYYSDPGDYTSWPTANSLSIPDAGDDEIVAMVRLGTALVVIDQRRIYRVVSRGEPGRDANLFYMAQRGAINGRCAVAVEGYIYMLDESGVHRYDGSEETEDISSDIQNMFQDGDPGGSCPQIDWDSPNRKLWHANVDTASTAVRWFVDLVGKESLQYAICFNYRLNSWWIESYPMRVMSSCSADLVNRRPVAGCDLRRVVTLGEGATDLVDPADGTLRGTATGGGSYGITDSAAVFPSTLAGCPVSIVDGPGRGQSGVIVSNDATSFTVRDQWPVLPAAGSVYQIGGVRWEWLSGWLDVVDSESDTERDVVITYEPQQTETFADMQIYYDHQSAPESWGFDWNADGVTVEADSPWIMFDFHFDQVAPGYRFMRLKSHHDPYAYGDRYVQVLLSGVQNASVIRIYQLQMSGVEYNQDVNQQ